MAYADFDEMKKEFPARNFDNVDITEDFNIAAQNSAGVYGAFKFFHGIKSFFKGITALGKLASGSKILVADESGNISYTTPSDITNGLATTESVNNALATYKLTDFNPSSYSNDTDLFKGLVARAFAIKDYRVVEGEIIWSNHWFGFVRVFSTSATSGTIEVIDHTNRQERIVKVSGDTVTIDITATKTDLEDKIKIETTVENTAISIGAGQNSSYNATKPTNTNYQWYLLTIFHTGSAYVEECFHSLEGYVTLRNNFTSELSIKPSNQWLGIKK